MGRDNRLLAAIVSFGASALGLIAQLAIIQDYIDAAIDENWTEFVRSHGLDPTDPYPPNCMDVCRPEMPLTFGLLGITFFLIGFVFLMLSWRLSSSS